MQEVTELIAMKDVIINSAIGPVKGIIDFFPYIMKALGITIIGYLISIIVEKMIVKSSNKLRLGWISEKIGLSSLLKKSGTTKTPAMLIGRILKGYIFTLFLINACEILNLTQIAEFLDAIINYIPKLVIALIIVLLGIQISNTLGGLVFGALNFTSRFIAQVISHVARYSIIFFSILAALTQLNIATALINILFVGFVSMIALAGGLAFGLGGKDLIHDLLTDLQNKEIKLKKIRK